MTGEKRKSRRFLVVLIAAILLSALFAFGASRGNRVHTTLGGRDVVGETANVLTGGKLSSDGKSIRLELGIPMTAQVTQDAVVLSDGSSIAIPAACRKVEVKVRDDRLVVSLDGVAAN